MVYLSFLTLTATVNFDRKSNFSRLEVTNCDLQLEHRFGGFEHKGEVRGALFAEVLPFAPIFQEKPRHPFKFFNIVCYQFQATGPGMAGNHHIIRPYGLT